MGLMRHGEEGVQRRRDEVARLKAEISNLEETAKGRESEFWQIRLGPAIHNSIKANEVARDAILDGETKDAAADLANVKGLAGGIRAYRHILNAVENTEALIDSKRRRAAQLVQELEEIKAEQGV